MLFNSVEFIVYFLPLTWLIFFLLGRYVSVAAATTFLGVSSLFFYGWWNPKYVVLILISVVFNFNVGRTFHSKSAGNQKLTLALGVFANLAVLGYFKYANFFVENINGLTSLDIQLGTIVLPLAISFFTFQQIAFLVDAYRGELSDCNFLQYCVFVMFFPQLIAGPIVHHKEVLPQFADPAIYRINSDNVADGITFFVIGLFKKAVLADGLASYVGPIFAAADGGSEISFFVGWSAALAYTFQLYFDFSGYSDMAIGIGRMFNIQLPANFYSPYKSTNIIDFWRRWHITLSAFLRDYLYIPLGGSRCGKWRRYVNLMLTMIIGGLWHGASWTFVFWGALHGLYLVINHGFRKLRQSFGHDLSKSSWIGNSFGWLITFSAVIVGWVFFRAETFSGGANILTGMLGFHGFVLPEQLVKIIPGTLAQFIDSTGSMPLLGGGSVVGIIEMLGLFSLSFFLIAMPASQEMGVKLKMLALLLCFYFAIQAVFFSRAPSEFLYFQF